MTNEAIKKREGLQTLMDAYGYKSIRKLCRDAGVSVQNLYSNITGVYEISMGRMFKLANTLGCDVLDIIKIFYADLYMKNQQCKSSN